jgi:hypothetical protein
MSDDHSGSPCNSDDLPSDWQIDSTIKVGPPNEKLYWKLEAATLLTTRAYERRILNHLIEFRSSEEASAAENLDVSIL